MGGNQSTYTKVTDEVRNEMINRADAACQSVCTQTQTGNIIVIDGSAGNIEISQECKATSSCIIKNSLNSSVKTILEAILASDQDFQGSPISFTWNSQRSATDNELLLENKITNIMSATCNSEVSQMQSDNIIYVKGTAGNVALTQDGNAKSNCTLDNIAKMTAYNDVAKDISNGQNKTGVFGALFAAIGTMIIFGVIMFIMMVMFTGLTGTTQAIASNSSSKKSNVPAQIELTTIPKK